VRNPLPPVPLTLADHRLRVFDEPPLTGRGENKRAWAGSVDAFPSYLIYPHRIAESPGGFVAVLGHTTGSHLGLADDEDARQTLIWVAECLTGAIRGWTLIEDTPLTRARYGLDAQHK
jgi:hypothetical protein